MPPRWFRACTEGICWCMATSSISALYSSPLSRYRVGAPSLLDTTNSLAATAGDATFKGEAASRVNAGQVAAEAACPLARQELRVPSSDGFAGGSWWTATACHILAHSIRGHAGGPGLPPSFSKLPRVDWLGWPSSAVAAANWQTRWRAGFRWKPCGVAMLPWRGFRER